MKLKVASVLAIIAAFVAGWFLRPLAMKPKPDPTISIQGQVFIVSGKGDSVKLGGVFVSLIPKADFDRAFIQSIASHREDIKNADAWVASCKATADKELAILYAAKTSHDEYEATQALKLDNEGVENAIEQKGTIIWEVANEIWSAVARSQLAMAQTDADGNFLIHTKEPKGDFYVVAQASRKTSGLDETLMWAVEGWAARSPLLLTNDNRFHPEPLGFLPPVR